MAASLVGPAAIQANATAAHPSKQLGHRQAASRPGSTAALRTEPLVGLPGLRLHLLVGRAVAYIGGLVPGIGEVVALVGGPLLRVSSAWASSRAAARCASPDWTACNAAPARPARASAARTLA
jgi:hypothetical protein